MEVKRRKRKLSDVNDNNNNKGNALVDNLKRLKLKNKVAWEKEASDLPETRLQYLVRQLDRLNDQMRKETNPETRVQLQNKISQLKVKIKRFRGKRNQSHFAPKEMDMDERPSLDYSVMVRNRTNGGKIKKSGNDEGEDSNTKHDECVHKNKGEICVSDVFDNDINETMKEKTFYKVNEQIRKYLLEDKGSESLLDSSIMSPGFMRSSSSNEIYYLNRIVPSAFPLIRRLLAKHPPDGKPEKLAPLMKDMQVMLRRHDESRGEGAPLWEWSPEDPSGIPACWTHKQFLRDGKEDCVGTWILGDCHRMYEKRSLDGKKRKGISDKPVGPVLPAYFPPSDIEEYVDKFGKKRKRYKYGDEWPDMHCLLCFRYNARIVYGINRDRLNQVGEKPEFTVRDRGKRVAKGSKINPNDGDHRRDIEFFLYNRVGVEGEYCASDTFIDPVAGFPLNIVMNQRNMYKLERDPETKKRYFKQLYPYPEQTVDPVFRLLLC